MLEAHLVNPLARTLFSGTGTGDCRHGRVQWGRHQASAGAGMRVRLSRVHFPVTTLARAAEWGCGSGGFRYAARAAGPETFWEPAATTIDVLALLNPFSEADGLTVSGGEGVQPTLWARS